MLPPSRCTPDRRRPTTNPREGAKQETTVAPMLSVRHGAQAIEFYKAAFGAQELLRIEDQGGAVVARLAIGESEFWLADESPEHLNFSPETLAGSTVRMVMTVENPDDAFQRAIDAGARVVSSGFSTVITIRTVLPARV